MIEHINKWGERAHPPYRRIINNVSKYCPLQEMKLNSMPIHVKIL